MTMRFRKIVAALFVVGLLTWTPVASACPFCSAQALTFSEEIKAADVAVIARLAEVPKILVDSEVNPSTEIEKLAFTIEHVFKGKEHLGTMKSIKTIYFGQAGKGSMFLMLGFEPPKLSWTSPIAMGDRGIKYLQDVVKLPEKGVGRLAFFQEYLEDKDEMLSRDAYDEFAKAPYSQIVEIKDRLKHDQFVSWIKDAKVPTSRRRLYLTLLSVCGTKDDLPMLESLIKSKDRKQKAGLDALVSSYLMLKGEAGVGLIEDLFLKNSKAEYTDTYAAIMAIRFHGQEKSPVPKKRLLGALRHMLDRPQLADLIIPDLARWEDWESMDRLVKLFKDSDEQSSWVRVPVINYLRACPTPAAKLRLAELARLDPESFKRANSFFPFGGAGSKKGKKDASADEKPATEKSNSKVNDKAAPMADTSKTDKTSQAERRSLR